MKETTLLWLIFFAVSAVGLQQLVDQATGREKQENALAEVNMLLREIRERL